MAAGGSLLVGIETLGLSLGHWFVQLRLTSLVNGTRLGIESAWVVAEGLELLVLGATAALETDARFSRALASVVSTFLRRDVLRVGATASLTCAADANRRTRELFEAGLVDARLFRGDGGLGVERILETAVRLVVKITELQCTQKVARSVSIIS